jgi:hypothetical protein
VRDQPSDDEDADDCETNCCEVVVKMAYGAPKASASSKPELIASQIKGLQSPTSTATMMDVAVVVRL